MVLVVIVAALALAVVLLVSTVFFTARRARAARQEALAQAQAAQMQRVQAQLRAAQAEYEFALAKAQAQQTTSELAESGARAGVGARNSARTSIRVPYGRYTLLRDGNDLVAIRPDHDDSWEPGRLSYRWLHLSTGSADFTQPAIPSGTVDLYPGPHKVPLTAGPFSFEWSAGNDGTVLLEWPASRPDLAVYAESFDGPPALPSAPRGGWVTRNSPATKPAR
jgi:hypothetical protein